MITKVRIDHRLLHGQVAFSWIKSAHSDCILIVSDEAASDELRMSALRMASPNNTKMVIKSVKDSATALNSGVTDKYQLFIIVESIKEAAQLTSLVPTIKEINIGGTKAGEDKKQISKAVFVSEEDVDLIKKMHQNGIRMNIRMIPDEPMQDVMDLI